MMISLLHISLLYVLHIFSIYDSDDLKVLGRRLYGVFFQVGYGFLFLVYFMDCLNEHWRSFEWGLEEKRDWFFSVIYLYLLVSSLHILVCIL